MSLTARIKDDYGTLKRFARLHGINLQSLYMTVNGYPRLSTVAALKENGYIKSVDDLRKAA